MHKEETDLIRNTEEIFVSPKLAAIEVGALEQTILTHRCYVHYFSGSSLHAYAHTTCCFVHIYINLSSTRSILGRMDG